MRALNELLTELFRLHHRDLVRFAARLVGDREDGEEIAQDTYMRIARLGARAGTIDYPKTYLFTAARNAAIDFTARQRTEWSHRVDVEDLTEIAAQNDPFDGIEARLRLARLAVALNELPRACRQTFVMNKIEGHSHLEIAAALGISVSMVEKHMMRALLHCRDVLRETNRS